MGILGFMTKLVENIPSVKLDSKHLLTIRELETGEVFGLVERAAALKRGWKNGYAPQALAAKSVALIFEKPSTRTRVSFELAVVQLGGHAMFMPSSQTQMARSEPLADTARVMSRYVDAMVVRTYGQEVVEELAARGDIPVVNALTDKYHPCQVLSDLLTVQEQLGNLVDPIYCWLGDGNNMAHSWIEASACLGFELRLACPKGFLPDAAIMKSAQERGAKISLVNDPKEAIQGAQVISTDVWASMGQEEEAKTRQQAFAGFTLDSGLMALADPKAIVMHCLPAHRGEEISEEVLEGPNSVVWDQAENRLHMQKAILEALVGRGAEN
jgi:ornithine carbamoyltransferase